MERILFTWKVVPPEKETDRGLKSENDSRKASTEISGKLSNSNEGIIVLVVLVCGISE
jgi:hypothetical protein